MAYATVLDVQARIGRDLTEAEQTAVSTMLDDAAIIIDAFAADAPEDAKMLVSCRMVARAIAADDAGYPVGATQGSMSGLGYSQSWTIGSGGTNGELYLSKLEKSLLGRGNRIGSYSPLEGMVQGCAD